MERRFEIFLETTKFGVFKIPDHLDCNRNWSCSFCVNLICCCFRIIYVNYPRDFTTPWYKNDRSHYKHFRCFYRGYINVISSRYETWTCSRCLHIIFSKCGPPWHYKAYRRAIINFLTFMAPFRPHPRIYGRIIKMPTSYIYLLKADERKVFSVRKSIRSPTTATVNLRPPFGALIVCNFKLPRVGFFLSRSL